MPCRPRHRFVALVLSASLATGVAAQPADYLDADLRARVEQLKAEVAERPTDANTVRQRTDVLWDWLNAYSMTGGYLPVNLTTVARRPASTSPAALAGMDAFIGELTVLDERPEALGTLSADTGPFEARSRATFTQTWAVGTQEVAPGGGIAVTRHFMGNHGAFQTDDPGGDGLVSISSSNASARFVADAKPVAGMHGGFRGAVPVLFFRLATGRLGAGDTVTVTYGDRSGGGGGLLMPSFSSDRMPFPLYVAFEEGGHLFSLPIQPIRVIGTELAGVHGFAPSVVRPGAPFDLAVRAEDRFHNRARGPYPTWHAYANGERIGELPAGDGPIVVLGDVRFNAPGVYRITIASADGSIAGVANPILVSPDASPVYWGDTHGHSGFAEGIGTPDKFMTWAKEDARLDFVTHSEHDIWTDDFEWEVMKRNVADYSEEGRFIAYLGYEWSTRNQFGGHHNVLFRTPQDRRRVPTQYFPTLSDLYAGLRNLHDPADVVVIPHAHQSGNYRLSDPKLQPLVEIMSQHGAFEWFGQAYLRRGHQVGFTAASDNHLAQPGYTAPLGGGLAQRGGLGGVLAGELSRDALFDAMKAARAYATTGDRIILQATVNDGAMGQRVPFAAERRIAGRVIGTGPIDTVSVVKNGEELWHRDYATASQDDRLRQEETFHLTFASSSVPMHRGDNPRGWRPWAGTLEVTGAQLAAVTPTDFFNPDMQRLETAANGIVHFATITRGETSSLRLTLRNVEPDARVRLVLEAGDETGGGPPFYRRHATVPASTVELPLAELRDGTVRRKLPFDVYEDTVTLRRLVTGGPQDVRFDIDDTGSIHGDYYYVRVKQVNEAMAWSSPVWVGGHPSR